jgi:prolyl oligopeptidase PreP (S9A serine peptidase family)
MAGLQVQAVTLPDVGSVGSLNGRKDDMEFFYSFTGFVTPGLKYRFDVEKMESKKIRCAHFTCFTSTKGTNTDAEAGAPPVNPQFSWFTH